MTRSIGQALWSALRGTTVGIYQSYRLGGKAMLAAPAILLLAALPELAQHILEIRIGMFNSLADAQRLQHLPVRAYFGYAKIAGVWAAVFLIARFWANGSSVRKAFAVPTEALVKAVAGIAAMLATGFAVVKLLAIISPGLAIAASLLSGAIQAMIFLWVIGVWLDETPIALKEAFTSRAPNALTLLVIFLASIPLTLGLHILIHKVVLGQPQIVVWTLMMFDALIVIPFSAALKGSALFIGYATAATWRGWGEGFRS
jgi:hypothetical protein